ARIGVVAQQICVCVTRLRDAAESADVTVEEESGCAGNREIMIVQVQRTIELHEGAAGVLERLAVCSEFDRNCEVRPVVGAARPGRIAAHATGQRYRVARYERAARVQDEVVDNELGKIVALDGLLANIGKPDVIAVLRMPVRRYSEAG